MSNSIFPPPEIDPLKVFSNRAVNYQFRPRYPFALIELIKAQCGLTPGKQVADIGSGTGYFTSLFLANGNPVYAVEPNAEMRAIAETELGQLPGFVSVEGIAEKIPLPAASMDLVAVGNALHWFDVARARPEILRILRPGGWVVVTHTNSRDEDSDFMRANRWLRENYFDNIGTASDPPQRVIDLFKGVGYKNFKIPYSAFCDEEGFRRGVLSSSIAPQPGMPNFDEFETALHKIFLDYEVNGKVEVLFEVVVYLGQF